MAIKSIKDIDLKNKKVLARFDFNVPLDSDGNILDASRVDLALPTIEYILDQGASKLTLMSHHGRPNGQVNSKFSLAPVAKLLAEKLKQEVIFTESAVDSGVKELLTLRETKIVLLENLRFNPEEENNDETFAHKLSEYGDIYVNDAFGAAHRKHASTHIINKFYPGNSCCGLLMLKEIESLDKILNTPKKPFVAIIGGAKVSDKIKTIEKLLVSVDKLIIGGAMAYPFLKSQGYEVGKSLCSDEDVKLAKRILNADKGRKIQLPMDHIISDKFGGKPQSSDSKSIDREMMALDIGPKTLESFSVILKTAKTVLWNGPMGAFENKDYANGTFGMCEVISNLDAFSLIGGGDSVSAANKSGLSSKFSHVSSGGGASLEYIENGELPGINAIKFGV